MSIYASEWGVDADAHADDCGRWVAIAPGGSEDGYPVTAVAGDSRYGLDDSRPCSCGTGPIGYQGSHVLPADDDPRGGSVDVAAIAGFIHREGRPWLCRDDDDHPCPKPATECCDVAWPWLRLWVSTGDGPKDLPPGNAVVLLDRDQVAALHAYLGRWLGRAVPDPPPCGHQWLPEDVRDDAPHRCLESRGHTRRHRCECNATEEVQVGG